LTAYGYFIRNVFLNPIFYYILYEIYWTLINIKSFEWILDNKYNNVMEKNEIIEYWIKLSEEDYSAMVNLFKSGNYSWSLFIGHLVVEKLLKAYYVKNCDMNPPHTHNLTQIAKKQN